jgi:hypothetical protein
MTEDEMTYTEGGVTYSARQCRDFVAALGFASAQSMLAVAQGAAAVAKVLKWVKGIGGPLTWLVGIAVGIIGQAIGKVGYGIAYAALKGKSVVITATPAFWESFVNVTWK